MRAASPTADPAWELFVFRKARQCLSTSRLREELLLGLRPALARADRDGLLHALVRAGELECALADAAHPALDEIMPAVDALAALAADAASPWPDDQIFSAFDRVSLPQQVSLSHPEGFSYYGLHPLDFCDLAGDLRLQGNAVAVLGIRSIGTTLSSIVAQTLRGRGFAAERITVRPSGPPYGRSLKFSAAELRWVRKNLERRAEFLVVDEGPGFSGSSFTSVGRALRQAGVPGSKILLLGSRPPGPTELESKFDPEWSTFRFCSAVQGTRLPNEASIYCGGGTWRMCRFSDLAAWPACWTQLERNKYFSRDACSLFKFEGFGRFGEAVHRRARRLAAAGFAPPVLGYSNGYVEYASAAGKPALHGAGRRDLERLAEYCAFRVSAEAADQPSAVPLESMLSWNLRLEFGIDPQIPQMPLEKIVVSDSRMMPYEWIRSGEQLLKTDGTSHGDDHLFPGPTDIAWDLAGIIVEWDLRGEQSEFFLSEYRRRSGDDAGFRVRPYLLAYSVFRAAFCRMGAAAMAAWDEAHRLRREYLKHRARVVSLLRLPEPAAAVPALAASLREQPA